MARLRPKERSADDFGVPPELRDWDSPVWKDPALFTVWVRDNLTGSHGDRRMEYLCKPDHVADRFGFAVTQWALQNGFRGGIHPNSLNHELMERAGLKPFMPALERARRRLILNEQQE